MTKPTGRPRGRPRKPVAISGTDSRTLHQIAHAYFLKIQENVLSTCLEMGITMTVDIKAVKRIIGQKLVAEATKQTYLQPQPLRSDRDDDIDTRDGSDDDE